MRILLVGEYSGFHNALKHGLQYHGHEVTIVGNGDGFKQYPVDVYVGSTFFNRHKWLHKFKVLVWKLTGYNLADRLVLLRFRESEALLKNHDKILFINSNPFSCEPKTEWKMIKWLLENNGNATLIACGDDVVYADYIVNKEQEYSIITSVKDGLTAKKSLKHTYKYLQNSYIWNYKKLVEQCNYIIPSNTDYWIAIQDDKKSTEIIPAPVVIEKWNLVQNENLEVIEIFMGINRSSYWKKGIYYFEKALHIIKEKYQEKVNVTIAENMPYDKYKTAYESCHILLDQVLCHDQGYNALEAMIQGKVVFAGSGKLYEKAHGIKSPAVIDAKPDVNYLVNKLSILIDHPETILKMGQDARNHVVKYHDCIKISSAYLKKL